MKKTLLILLTILFLLAMLTACNRAANPEETPDIYSDFEAITWQEAYAELLRYYAALPLADSETGWYFILHDIDQNGVPELFLVTKYDSGHTGYRFVYSFINGRAIRLEFDDMMTDGGSFAPLDGRPWVVIRHPAGAGGVYYRMAIDGYRLIPNAIGLTQLSEAGFERAAEGVYLSHENYYWFYLYDITDGWNYRKPLDVEEFENLFGNRSERNWFELHPINEDNIQRIIFG